MIGLGSDKNDAKDDIGKIRTMKSTDSIKTLWVISDLWLWLHFSLLKGTTFHVLHINKSWHCTHIAGIALYCISKPFPHIWVPPTEKWKDIKKLSATNVWVHCAPKQNMLHIHETQSCKAMWGGTNRGNKGQQLGASKHFLPLVENLWPRNFRSTWT